MIKTHEERIKMKQQKNTQPNKNKARQLYWLLFIPVIGFYRWALEIGNDTLTEESFNLWYIPFAIIGLAIGIIRLIRDKEIVWNWKEYLCGALYAFIHSVIVMLIATTIFGVISILNFYIPTNHPNYEETATVINKSFHGNRTRSYSRYNITFRFENEKIDNEVIGVDKALFNQIEPGDTYIFTLQNGFFNFPVIKDKTKQ